TDKRVSEWKKVELFNTIPLPFVKCPSAAEISCYCFYESKSTTEEMKIRIVICDQNGNILVYLSNWECITFKSQARRDTITLCSLTLNNWLATATSDSNYGIHIDIYDLRRLTKNQGAPIIASGYFQVTSTASCITAEVIDDKLLLLAIGFENGDMILHYGKITRIFSASIRQHTVSGYAIKGIHFNISDLQSDPPTHGMFVTCLQGVYYFMLKEKSCVDQTFILDNDKCNINHCSTMRKPGEDGLEESMLVVGREDAVYCYTCEGRGPCFAIEGTKKHLAWVGHYLIVAAKSILKQNISTLIIVDTENKIIVFQKQLQELLNITSETDFCYIISNTNQCKVFLLQQLNISNKIRILIEKNLYDIALRLLHREGYTYSQEAALVRFQYGNYLLLKGDISRAVKEFIKTIGFIKPYSVISKLLYSRYNNYLKAYISELSHINTSSGSYTNLIECCVNREKIKHEIQQISDNDKLLSCPSTQELKQLSNLSKMYFECKIRNQSQVEEEHLLHTFLEYGPKTILVDPTTYLENIKFENVNTPENILSFLSSLPDQSDYRSKMLAKIIEKFPNCNESLYFYLLLLYLVLWQKNEVTTSYVLNFVKKKKLRLDRVLIICRLYSFFNLIQEMKNNQQNDDAMQHEAVNKCIHTLIDNNPKDSLNCNTSKRTFLIMLKSSCSNDKVKALQIKPLLREKIIRDIVDSANEVQLIANFNDKIRSSSLMLSLYTNNPMEFRNDSCDICRETLTTQSIYFLCQHSFHKECLSYNSTKRREEVICVVCKTKKNLLNIKSAKVINSDSSNIIAGIAKVLAIGTKKIENKSMIKQYVKTVSESNDRN
ncbi:hypothetical protein KR084_005135, partial [Drosophila pseudotakahashii]